MKFSATIEEFAARRRSVIDEAAELLRPVVRAALGRYRDGLDDWADAIVEAAQTIFETTLDDEGGTGDFAPFRTTLVASLEQTRQPEVAVLESQVERISLWLAAATVNAATFALADAERGQFVLLEWVTMGDEDVRDLHTPLQGVQRPVGETFDVGGFDLRFPGEPVGPPEIWIGCRCVVRPVLGDEASLRSALPLLVPDAGHATPLPGGLDDGPVVMAALAHPGSDGYSAGGVANTDVLRVVDAPQVVGTHAQGVSTEVVNDLGPRAVRKEPRDTVRGTLGLLGGHPEGAVPGDPGTVSVERGASPGPAPIGLLDLGPEALFHRHVPSSHTPSIPVRTGDEMTTTFAVEEDDTDLIDAPIVDSEDDLAYEPVPVHGVLAPLDTMSGDRRKLTGEITWVDTPFPIRWVKEDVGMHQGAVRTTTVDEVFIEGNEIRFNGHMMSSKEADEHLNVLAEGKMGLSVDLDSAVFELQDENGNPFDFDMYEMGDPEPVQVVTSGRIRAATAVDISAFVEAWMGLGTWENETVTAAGCAPCVAAELNGYYGDYIDFAISEQPWDGSASRFTIEEWRRSTLIDTGEGDEDSKSRYKLPIREPNGDINRAGVHAAASRIDQVEAPDEAVAQGRRRLIAAYRAIDEEAPESLTASAFAPGTKDGPGWITNPRETARIRRYWTHGAGAKKIGWGTPGQFQRCRTQLKKYIKNPKWLAGTCANMTKEATGFWPGQERLAVKEGTLVASAFTLVDEETATLPHRWFTDQHLPGPTPVTVTEEGHVFGHVALWETCHIGYGLSVKQGSDCVAPPNSTSDYAYFKTGVVDTEKGEVATGVLTMGTGHAPERLRSTPAAAHYDNTGMAVADVNVGEDEFGIWFSGAMRPGLSPEDVRAFKASSLSGDWRTIKRNYEMVAALVVNVPGFPIPRRSMAASGGRQTTLVAAGVLHRNEVEYPDPIVDMDALVAEVERRMELKQRRINAQAAVRQFRLTAARDRLGM